MMTSIDFDLVLLIYVLYLYECVHWIKEDEIAYTRSYSGRWKRWEHTAVSFTLLNRLPCLVSLVPIAWGFISVHRKCSSEDDIRSRLLTINQMVNRSHRSLHLASSIQAIVMLIVVPLIVGLQHLEHFWLPLLTLILISHGVTVMLFTRNLRRWKPDLQGMVVDLVPVCANPLAAIRSADILSRRMFEALKDGVDV